MNPAGEHCYYGPVQAIGVRLFRTRRTRATAPAIPAQARIVDGSGTGDGKTVPSGAYTAVRAPSGAWRW